MESNGHINGHFRGGAYAVRDAALYIRATMRGTSIFPTLGTRHLFRWVHEGLVNDYLASCRKDEVVLTFLDLVTLRMVANFRALGVKPKEIKEAHRIMRELTGEAYPFASRRCWVAGPDIFMLEADLPAPLAVSKAWQLAFEFIREHVVPVHNLRFGRGDPALATSWAPHRGVTLDPRVRWGEPCLSGTGIATETLWAFREAGDSEEAIAKAYRLERRQVRQGLAWEKRIAAVAGEAMAA